jgi:hypothetical protein
MMGLSSQQISPSFKLNSSSRPRDISDSASSGDRDALWFVMG